MENDELALAQSVAAGDEEALRALTLRYGAPLRRYLWRQLHDTRAVEETLQDVFVAVWRGAANYRGDAKVVTWLFQIAHYLALRARRNEQRHAGDEPLAEDEGDESDGAQEPGQNGWSASLEDAVINRLALAAALERLTEKHREVVELAFVFGFSAEEIARIIEAPVGTVKSRISYARRALALALNDGAPTTQPTHAAKATKEEQP